MEATVTQPDSTPVQADEAVAGEAMRRLGHITDQPATHAG
jgi:hypothetical protein